MKRNRSLVVGVLCGLCCMVRVALYVSFVDGRAQAQSAEALERYGGDQIEVCVASRDIAAGEIIDEACLDMKTWIATLVPEGAVTTVDDAIGKQVGSSILKGEVISSKRFDSHVTSFDIPDGLTAISVPAKEVQTVGGALAAGMRADVYAIGSSSTTKLASQALIVATSTGESGLSSSSISWVTLAVPPSIVEELVTAAENLELYFVLPASTHEDTAKAADEAESSSEGASNETASNEVSGETTPAYEHETSGEAAPAHEEAGETASARRGASHDADNETASAHEGASHDVDGEATPDHEDASYEDAGEAVPAHEAAPQEAAGEEES